MRLSRLKKPLLALACGLGTALLCAEALVRATVGAPLAERLPVLRILPHATRGWRMVPNENHFTYLHRVRVNSHGLRGPEIGPKRPDTLRVLALGDSLTYGQGVAGDETLPHYLERFLNDEDPEGRRWEVINAGHRSYNTRQEIELAYEFAAEFQPDHVILFWFRDDLAPRDLHGNYERIAALPVPVAFDTGTRIEGWERVRWHALQTVRRSALAMFLHDSLNTTPSKPLKVEIRATYMGRLDHELERLLSLGESIGFRSWLIPIPHRIRLELPEASARLTHDALRHAQEQGLGTVDLFPTLHTWFEDNGRLPVLPYDGHYDAQGNRIMGRAVAEALWRR